jgi:hypothetical protein
MAKIKMKSKKKNFSFVRKLSYSLALFVLVFAAASVVKIQAAGNVTGWLWGGSEDSSIGGSAGSIDGNETGLGWISMTGTNYGVTIPDSDGDLSGYAWSENVGWISFNASDLSGCPSGTCSARREGDRLVGWARIMSIAQAGANAGGWQGWIKLSSESGDPVSFGVKINSDGTFVKCETSSGGMGCAWNAENAIAGVPQGLGWIDFSRASVEEMCSLTFSPPTVTINENSSGMAVLSETGKTSCKCKNVKIQSTDTSVADGVSPTTANYFEDVKIDSADISFNTKFVDSTKTFYGIIKATSDNCGTASLDISILNAPTCTISAPSSFTIAPGQTDSYPVQVGGGCNLDSCDGGTAKITVSKVSGSDRCSVTASPDSKYSTTTAHAHSGSASAPTEIKVSALGWVEVN